MSRETARYTYTAGTRGSGAIVYDTDSKIHNHDDTNVARGQHSAFDLVRLHRFGHLDKDAGALSVTDLPSYKAMREFAEALPEIRAARGQVDLVDLGPEAPANDSWLSTSAAPALRFAFQEASEYVSGPPMRWLVSGVLPQAELAVIYGQSGSGKSFLGYDVAAAITRGEEWCGRRTVKGQVAYIAAEGGHGLKARVRAYAEKHGGYHDLPRITRVAPNLMNDGDAVEIVKAMRASGPYVAVIIDTLSRSHQGNENSGDDMGKVLKCCQIVHEHTGAIVCLIHHSGKEEARGQRGWSGLKAAADAEIEVTRTGDYRTWTTSKMKDGSDNVSGSFKLKVISLGEDQDGEAISSCIVEHTGAAKKMVKQRRRPKHNALTVLQAMEAKFQTMAPTVDQLYEACSEQIDCPAPKRRREYFRRAVVALRDTETNKWLWRHAGDRVALTAVLPGNSEEFGP